MDKRLKKIHFIPALLLLAAALVLLSIFGREGEEGERVKNETDLRPRVVVSVVEKNKSWVNDFLYDLTKEEEAYEVIYHEPEKYTASWQEADLLSVIEEGACEYLILLPGARHGLEEILSAAGDQGIRVLLITKDAESFPGAAAYIEADYEAEGALIAQALIRAYEGQTCRIAVLRESQDSVISVLREKGFEKEIAGYENLTIADKSTGGGSLQTAISVMGDVIRNLGETGFDAVFACSGEDGLGAMRALESAGIRPGEECGLFSAGGKQDVEKAVIAGQYTASVRYEVSIGETVRGCLEALIGGAPAGSVRAFLVPVLFSGDTETEEGT